MISLEYNLNSNSCLHSVCCICVTKMYERTKDLKLKKDLNLKTFHHYISQECITYTVPQGSDKEIGCCKRISHYGLIIEYTWNLKVSIFVKICHEF